LIDSACSHSLYVDAQVLHFCYGLGAFVSPMITEPFLLNEDCSLFVDNDTSSYGGGGAELVSGQRHAHSADLSMFDLNATVNLLPAKTLSEAQQMTKVRFAFWIMATLMVRNSMALYINKQIHLVSGRFIIIRNSSEHNQLLLHC